MTVWDIETINRESINGVKIYRLLLISFLLFLTLYSVDYTIIFKFGTINIHFKYNNKIFK